MSKIIIPADVAERLIKASKCLVERAERLDYLHALYADEDSAPDWEWQIKLDHSEAELMAKNLRNIAQFADWLSEFSGGHNDG